MSRYESMMVGDYISDRDSDDGSEGHGRSRSSGGRRSSRGRSLDRLQQDIDIDARSEIILSPPEEGPRYHSLMVGDYISDRQTVGGSGGSRDPVSQLQRDRDIVASSETIRNASRSNIDSNRSGPSRRAGLPSVRRNDNRSGPSRPYDQPPSPPRSNRSGPSRPHRQLASPTPSLVNASRGRSPEQRDEEYSGWRADPLDYLENRQSMSTRSRDSNPPPEWMLPPRLRSPSHISEIAAAPEPLEDPYEPMNESDALLPSEGNEGQSSLDSVVSGSMNQYLGPMGRATRQALAEREAVRYINARGDRSRSPLRSRSNQSRSRDSSPARRVLGAMGALSLNAHSRSRPGSAPRTPRISLGISPDEILPEPYRPIPEPNRSGPSRPAGRGRSPPRDNDSSYDVPGSFAAFLGPVARANYAALAERRRTPHPVRPRWESPLDDTGASTPRTEDEQTALRYADFTARNNQRYEPVRAHVHHDNIPNRYRNGPDYGTRPRSPSRGRGRGWNWENNVRTETDPQFSDATGHYSHDEGSAPGRDGFSARTHHPHFPRPIEDRQFGVGGGRYQHQEDQIESVWDDNFS